MNSESQKSKVKSQKSKTRVWQEILVVVLSMVSYTILSWVLLFRQEQTLGVLGQFYPGVASVLPMVRSVLLRAGLNSVVTILLAMALGAGFWAYFKLLRAKLTAKTAIVLALLLQGIVFFSYPVLSTDIFDYILTNRLAVVYQKNIWEVSPAAFPDDPFYHLANWQNQIAPYGAVNQFFYNFPAIFAGEDLLADVVANKLLVVAFVIATLILLKNLLGKNSAFAILLLFVNPLFVVETAGNAHNIILTIFGMLLAYYFFLNKRFVLAGLTTALVMHTKFIPIFLAGFMVLLLIRERDYRAVLRFVVPFLGANLVLFAVMGIGAVSYLINILIGKPIYWQSLPMLVHRIYPGENVLFLVGFGIFGLVQVIRGLSGRDSVAALFVQTVLVYLLFFANFFLNWYGLWLLAFVPFLPWGRLAKTVLVFTLASALAYPLYHLSLRFNYQHPVWPILIYALITGVPAVYYLYGKLLAKEEN